MRGHATFVITALGTCERVGEGQGWRWAHCILLFVKILTATIKALITPAQLLEPEFQEHLGFSQQHCLENC